MPQPITEAAPGGSMECRAELKRASPTAGSVGVPTMLGHPLSPRSGVRAVERSWPPPGFA